jgi:hypothetical protein
MIVDGSPRATAAGSATTCEIERVMIVNGLFGKAGNCGNLTRSNPAINRSSTRLWLNSIPVNPEEVPVEFGRRRVT